MSLANDVTRRRLTDLLLYLLGFFTLLSLSAAALLIAYGFQGGHGGHDLLIVLLGLPGSAVLPLIPDILLSDHSDMFNVIALPWIVNTVFATTVYIAARPFTVREKT